MSYAGFVWSWFFMDICCVLALFHRFLCYDWQWVICSLLGCKCPPYQVSGLIINLLLELKILNLAFRRIVHRVGACNPCCLSFISRLVSRWFSSPVFSIGGCLLNSITNLFTHSGVFSFGLIISSGVSTHNIPSLPDTLFNLEHHGYGTQSKAHRVQSKKFWFLHRKTSFCRWTEWVQPGPYSPTSIPTTGLFKASVCNCLKQVEKMWRRKMWQG